MNEYIIRKARAEDLEEVLRLQQANHHKNVSAADKLNEGFVSVETDLKTLKRINKMTGIVVADANGKVVGYELPLTPDEAGKIPLLIPFIERILKLKYAGRDVKDFRWLIEGQILVDKQHKGRGVAEGLHRRFVEMLKPNYDLIITEVSDQNPRSLHVHTKKLGLSIVQQYSAEGRNWYVLLQDIRGT
jgi:L-amino acid N-acyltransferase YncA